MINQRAITLFILCSLLGGVGCNDHPVEPLDQVLSAVSRVENRLPDKTKLDFLFVIDNSGSMGEEQQRLAKNFQAFSDFLFDELQDAADYRIAVTSTDIGAQIEGGPQGSENPIRGKFLYTPANPEISVGRRTDENGEVTPIFPNTGDCEPGLDPIISSEQVSTKEQLEKAFRCRATLGIKGFYFEKGLEAMRLSLSCQGPNSSAFEQCCENYGTPDAFYNPACVIPPDDPGPDFLRPDANLIIIFISDENDCSTPADFPETSTRLICRPDALDNLDADGTPEIYQRFCPSIAPADCFRRECGNYIDEGGALKCRTERCDIKYSQNIECEWYSNRLTRVNEYRDFLQSLKARPLDQILVATIVGFRSYTELGNELRYPFSQMLANPDCTNDFAGLSSEQCCPEGACLGQQTVQPTCQDLDKGIIAYPGTRYLKLAEEFGNNGLGCPQGEEPEVDVFSHRLLTDASERCINICSEDFITPLNTIKERVADLISTYCLNRLPACRVPAQLNEAGELVSREHSCETNEELTNILHYTRTMRVTRRCVASAENQDACEQVENLSEIREFVDCALTDGECDDTWMLKLQKSSILQQVPDDGTRVDLEAQTGERPFADFVLEEGSCAAQVELSRTPVANSEVFVEFLVEVGSEVNGPSTDDQPNQGGVMAPPQMNPPTAGMTPAPTGGMTPTPAPTGGVSPAPTGGMMAGGAPAGGMPGGAPAGGMAGGAPAGGMPGGAPAGGMPGGAPAGGMSGGAPAGGMAP